MEMGLAQRGLVGALVAGRVRRFGGLGGQGSEPPAPTSPAFARLTMRRMTRILAAVVGTSTAALGLGAVPASAQLAPLTLSQAGADIHRHPFARWTPAWPLVNILVSTRPIRDADGTPAMRYWVQVGFMGSVPPETSWRGDDPLIPGAYYTSISGDAAFQHSPWTAFKRVEVKAKRGEWTGPTTQGYYIRLRRPRPQLLTRVSFSIYGANDGCRASFVLRHRIRVGADGRFSAHVRQSTLNGQTEGDVRIRGRVRRGFGRGTLRVADMYEGCKTGLVHWTARRR
jgi:hypothetical protein